MVRRAPKGFKDKAKGGKGKSLSKSAISRIMGAADSSVPGGSFSDLAKKEKQTQVKYDRPADLQKFVDRSRTYQKGIDLGGRVEDGVLQMIGADGIIRDAQGRQILSMSQPGITAVAPRNFMEALGDMKRVFTGYNTLSYDPNAIGTPSTTGGTILRNEGILSNIDPLSFIPGVGMAKKFIEGAKGVYDFMFPKPPVVTTGGSSSITVSEEPSGVINALPDTSLIKFEDIPSITDATASQFDPLGNPALYGDGTFFDRFDEQLEALGIEQDPLYS
tara:strand:+ start:2072 stop:2896 length:825 start_codon:yes stop_codon:yes gene_type:complete